MYKYYNANVLNKHEEDCVIRSISCATNKSWDYVYNMLSNKAQKLGTMMDNREFVIDYLNDNFKKINVKNVTVEEVSKYYNDKILLITMTGHITCSKYGIIYDTFDPSNRIVEYVWEVVDK